MRGDAAGIEWIPRILIVAHAALSTLISGPGETNTSAGQLHECHGSLSSLPQQGSIATISMNQFASIIADFVRDNYFTDRRGTRGLSNNNAELQNAKSKEQGHQGPHGI